MVEIFAFLIVLFALLVATYTDIKWREVPDWLSFALIAAGFGIAVTQSIVDLSFSPLISSLIGFGIALGIALLMFYTGQWGGGDAKILMGMGATIGAAISFSDFFLSFLFNIIVIGAAYGLLWGIALGIINRKKLFIEIRKIMLLKNIRILRYAAAVISLALAVVIFFLPLKGLRLSLLLLVLIIFSTLYLWIYVKAVEKVCMVKKINPKELTEGDWIIEDIIVNKKFIAGKKDLGASKEQIKKLISLFKNGKIKDVTIKTGIPFVPSFLMSYIITYFLGNLFLLVIR
jgi:Flp pilus assembly protein protease CpaA